MFLRNPSRRPAGHLGGSLAGQFVLMHWRVTFIRQGFGDSIGQDSVPSGRIDRSRDQPARFWLVSSAEQRGIVFI